MLLDKILSRINWVNDRDLRLERRILELRLVLQRIQEAMETKNSTIIKKNLRQTVINALAFDDKLKGT